MAQRNNTTGSIPLRVLKREERWDCHGCGHCCRGSIISLDNDDLERLKAQKWDRHPDLAGTRVIRRSSWFGRGYELARRGNGDCVFLTSEGRCRIHEQFGEEAKPRFCRRFPLQTVRLDRFAYLTVRRSCPSAALGHGRPLKEHVTSFRRELDRSGLVLRAAPPPAVTRRGRRPWKDVHRVADCLERLILDDKYPPVRRLVHGLLFCKLLDQCRLKRLDHRALVELLPMLESAATEDVGGVFRDRQPPSKSAASIFRQTLLEHLRLHPRYVIEPSWTEKWRLLRAGYRFTRGRGELPFLHPDFPTTTFDALERPLGPLPEEVIRPIIDYLETAVLSRHYMMLGRAHWPITDSFRALALSYAVTMWLIRLTGAGDTPTVDDAVDAVGAIERAHGSQTLCGRRHRHRVTGLEHLGQLGRILAWYAQ